MNVFMPAPQMNSVEERKNEQGPVNYPQTTPLSYAVRLRCEKCSIDNLLPSGHWGVQCSSCKMVLLSPQKIGFRYVEATCKLSKLFNVPLSQSIITCDCCHQSFKIVNQILKNHCGQWVYKSEKIEVYVSKMEMTSWKLGKENVELKQLGKENEELKRKLQELEQSSLGENKENVPETTALKTNTESNTTKSSPLAGQWKIALPRALCDSCNITREIVGWGSFCTTPACRQRTILAEIAPGFRYVLTSCSRPIFAQVLANSKWFSCLCCSKQHIIGST